MISIKCPHCQVKLKVDEGRLPSDITSFKCPRCKQAIPVSILVINNVLPEPEPETSLLQPITDKIGRITVLANEFTPQQTYSLYEGNVIIGRKSKGLGTIGIETTDRFMSREHIRVEIKKDIKGGYKHYLSDNNSKNRTLYNCSYLENGETVVLKNNDEIVLGRTVIRFNE